MRQYLFWNLENYVNFGTQFDAEILIWMQSRFDEFGFSATLVGRASSSLSSAM